MALDEQKDTDDVFDEKGYTFIVDKSLMQTAGPITVDGNQFGFRVNSNLQQNSGSGCNSCTSC